LVRIAKRHFGPEVFPVTRHDLSKDEVALDEEPIVIATPVKTLAAHLSRYLENLRRLT
jgi:hypothetical protein